MTFRGLLPALSAASLLAAACDGAPRDARAASAASPASAGRAAWSPPRADSALSDALGRRGQHGMAAAAVDASGVLHALFATDRDGDGWGDAVDYARLEGGAWSRPERLAATLTLTESPQVAVEGDGTVHALWYEHAGSVAPREAATRLVHRAFRTGRWSAAEVLYDEPHRAGIPDLSLAAAAGPRGGVEVLFQAQGRGIGWLTLRGGERTGPRFLDHDGRMTSFSAGAPGRPLEIAYVGEAVSPQRREAMNDVFVRSLADGGRAPRVEAYYGAGRYSHHPQLLVDGRGARHLVWLEDTDGSVYPEALFHATSTDGGRSWSAPRDVTPPSLRGGAFFRVTAALGADGRIHLVARHAVRNGRGFGLYHVVLRDGAASDAVPVAAPGELGPGDTQLVHDARRGRLVAAWRGMDGVYRWSELKE